MTWFYIPPDTYTCHKCGEWLHDDNVATDMEGFPARDTAGNYYCVSCADEFCDEINWDEDDDE